MQSSISARFEVLYWQLNVCTKIISLWWSVVTYWSAIHYPNGFNWCLPVASTWQVNMADCALWNVTNVIMWTAATEPPDSFRGKHTIVIFIETLCSNDFLFFRHVRKIAKKWLLNSSCLFVRLPGLPLDGFSRNLIFENFTKICRQNSSFIKVGQE